MHRNAPNCTYIEEKRELTIHDQMNIYDNAYQNGYRTALEDIENKNLSYFERTFKNIMSRLSSRKAP